MIDVTMTDSQFAPEYVLVNAELYYGIFIGALFASIIWSFIINFKADGDINQLTF